MLHPDCVCGHKHKRHDRDHSPEEGSGCAAKSHRDQIYNRNQQNTEPRYRQLDIDSNSWIWHKRVLSDHQNQTELAEPFLDPTLTFGSLGGLCFGSIKIQNAIKDFYKRTMHRKKVVQNSFINSCDMLAHVVFLCGGSFCLVFRRCLVKQLALLCQVHQERVLGISLWKRPKKTTKWAG